MKFIYNDGGRSKYFKGEANDCVVRAICNATGKDYKEVYDAINQLAKSERTGKRKRGVSSARNGVYKCTEKIYLESIGWVWHPTMQIGQGCTVHLAADELPAGTLIVQVSGHLTCVKDGVLYDNHDCTRGGSRCVYGYYTNAADEVKKQQRFKEIKAKIRALQAEIKELEKELDKVSA